MSRGIRKGPVNNRRSRYRGYERRRGRTANAFDIEHAMDAAGADAVAIDHNRTRIVMDLKAIMAAGPFHNIVYKLHAIGSLREIFKIELVTIAGIVADTWAIAARATGSAIVYVKVFEGNTGHGAATGLKRHPLRRRMAAFEVIEEEVLGSSPQRIDAVLISALLVKNGLPGPEAAEDYRLRRGSRRPTDIELLRPYLAALE
jgi:hypothetical protein